MKVRDLGNLDGNIALFGGIYSNKAALDAFCKDIGARKIPSQNVICSGDIVAYCAQAEECSVQIQTFTCPTIAGNCEVQLALNGDDCGCGFEDGSECSILSVGWYAHAKKQVSVATRAWMADLPDWITFTHANKKYVVLHGGASDIARFIWPVTSDAEICAEIDLIFQQIGPVDCVIAGHTGISMERTVQGIRWINPGAIGIPPNDGDPRGSFAVLNNGDIKFERFSYDYEKTSRTMKDANLTQGYHLTVKSGFWPSQETLPIEMRRDTPLSLQPSSEPIQINPAQEDDVPTPAF